MKIMQIGARPFDTRNDVRTDVPVARLYTNSRLLDPETMLHTVRIATACASRGAGGITIDGTPRSAAALLRAYDVGIGL